MNYFMDVSRLHTFEMAEKHIYPVLVNRDSLAEYQNKAVKMYVTGTDLGLTFRVRLGKESGPEISQAIVSEEMLASWGITEDELKEVAFSNLQREVEMESLTDVCGMPGAEDNVVVSNKNKMYGAAAILIPEVQDEVFKKLGPCYILPSSVHEVVAVKKKDRSLTNLIETVRHINGFLPSCDVLSGSVYTFGESGEFTIAKSEEIPYDRLLQILQDYVYNDVQAAELAYVRDALEMCGVDKAEAEKLGLGYIFENIEE